MTEYITAVYTIHNKDEFAEERESLFKKFTSSDGKPWAITAMSLGHELHRLELAEEAHQRNRHDLLDEIFGLVDPSIYCDLDEMIAANELVA